MACLRNGYPIGMATIHERFDLAKWVSEFPLAAERKRIREWVDKCDRENPKAYPNEQSKLDHIKLMEPDGDIVVGPRELAFNEQLRAECGGLSGAVSTVPVDVLVWAEGEPSNRAATKIGGTPYRPRGAEWPRNQDGDPCEFLGQMCFADSRDILTTLNGKRLELPGDILLLFNTALGGLFDSDEEDPRSLQYEWQPLGLSDLMEPQSLPAPFSDSAISPCHAQLHRTVDLSSVPQDHPLRSFESGASLAVFKSGKIAGLPHYVQDAEPRPGVFLGAFGSINPVGPTFPLLNVPVNPSGEFNMNGNYCMFGDCGSLYLFLEQPHGKRGPSVLHWTVQCY